MEAVWKEEWRSRVRWEQAREDGEGHVQGKSPTSKRTRDGEDAEDERFERYQALQQDEKYRDIVMEDVMSAQRGERRDEHAAHEQSEYGVLECAGEEVDERCGALRRTSPKWIRMQAAIRLAQVQMIDQASSKSW